MKIGKSRNLKTAGCCLNCGKLLDGASSVQVGKRDPSPRPGDFTVCAYCQHIMVFDDALHYRNPTFVELADIAHDPRVLAIKPILRKVFR